jgi:hypothetical protein
MLRYSIHVFDAFGNVVEALGRLAISTLRARPLRPDAGSIRPSAFSFAAGAACSAAATSRRIADAYRTIAVFKENPGPPTDLGQGQTSRDPGSTEPRDCGAGPLWARDNQELCATGSRIRTHPHVRMKGKTGPAPEFYVLPQCPEAAIGT